MDFKVLEPRELRFAYPMVDATNRLWIRRYRDASFRLYRFSAVKESWAYCISLHVRLLFAYPRAGLNFVGFRRNVAPSPDGVSSSYIVLL